MSTHSRPPPAISIHSLPPPAIPLTAELPPALLPIRDTNIGTRHLDVIPGLTDLATISKNMSEMKAPQLRERIEALEAQLRSGTKMFSTQHKIELYIDKFAYIAMNDARKMQQSLKEAGLSSKNQK